jgi:hypothetical protein
VSALAFDLEGARITDVSAGLVVTLLTRLEGGMSRPVCSNRLPGMNIALWITQILLVVVFGYSALIKSTQSPEGAVELGMTGVVNVPLPVMRFTASCEVLGVVGLIVPYVTRVLPILIPLAAIGLGMIMVLAARIHLGLGEPATAAGNLVLLMMCLFVAWGRWPG